MADVREWTAADDERVRAAMATLRADVDAAPLADVRFVKARGMQRRRHRMLAWTAAGAAAAAVASVVAFNPLGRDATAPLPPAHTSAVTPSPTSAPDRLAEPGALPLAQEWVKALGLKGVATVAPVPAGEPVECLAAEPGTKAQQESVTAADPQITGAQTRFTVIAGGSAETAAEGVAGQVGGCVAGPEFTVKPVRVDQWPRLFSYTAGEAGSGWFAVAFAGRDVALLQVVDAGSTTLRFTQEQVAELAQVATERLQRYGSATTAAPTPTPTGSPSGPVAINEKMPVTGVKPLLSSNLFVAASQWTSPFFGKGSRAYAGVGEPEGASSAVLQCETDDQMAEVGGRWGIVKIRAGGHDEDYVGSQRVRLFEGDDAARLAAADVKRLDTAILKGCSRPGETTTTAERGPSGGTYLITTKVTGPDASGEMYQWVGVTTQKTTGAVTTIVFHGTSDSQGFSGTADDGFAELDRLLALTRQK
jgi:hypothetical protein